MIGVFPPKMPPKDDWISLSSALTWLMFRHALELQELLDWADSVFVADEELRQLLTGQWQELIDHGWAKEIRLRGRVHGRTCSHELTRNKWRPFRYVGWRIHPQPTLQLLCDSIRFNGAAQAQTEGALRAVENPLIWRADVVAFKKVRHRSLQGKRAPDFQGAERDLRLTLSNVEPQTGLKWVCIDELVNVFHLPEYEAVRLWTQVTRELGFPERGRPRKLQNENARQ